MEHESEPRQRQAAETSRTDRSEGVSMPPPPLQLEANPAAPPPGGEEQAPISQEELMSMVHEAMGTSPDDPPVTNEELLDPLHGLREQASEAFRIPEEGWHDRRPMDGAARTMRVSSFRQNLEMIRNNPDVQQHILETLAAFANDPDPARRRTRDQIDLPLVLAIASRESGSNPIFLSSGERRVVTGGRIDTHRRGEGGLDNIGRHLDQLPQEIMDRDQPIDVNSTAPAPEGHPVGDAQRRALRAGLRQPDRHPGYMPERSLLAAYIVEVENHYNDFVRRYRERMSGLLTDAQAQALLDGMGVDARRSWTQARFGSHVNEFITRARTRIRMAAVRAGWSPSSGAIPDAIFQQILQDDEANLNSIVTSDQMIENNAPVRGGGTSSLSGHRVRISTAEAWMFEQALQLSLQNPEGQRSETPAPAPQEGGD